MHSFIMTGGGDDVGGLKRPSFASFLRRSKDALAGRKKTVAALQSSPSESGDSALSIPLLLLGHSPRPVGYMVTHRTISSPQDTDIWGISPPPLPLHLMKTRSPESLFNGPTI